MPELRPSLHCHFGPVESQRERRVSLLPQAPCDGCQIELHTVNRNQQLKRVDALEWRYQLRQLLFQQFLCIRTAPAVRVNQVRKNEGRPRTPACLAFDWAFDRNVGEPGCVVKVVPRESHVPFRSFAGRHRCQFHVPSQALRSQPSKALVAQRRSFAIRGLSGRLQLTLG